MGNIQREGKSTKSAKHPVSAWNKGTVGPRNIAANKVLFNTE